MGHPSEVDEIFDSISYNKGASVIRMLYDWIGDAAFKTGMHNYLTKYSYGNTLTGQLWAELEAASGLPVESVMRTWTEQMGFPCIKVTSSQEGEDRLLHLSQVTQNLSRNPTVMVFCYFVGYVQDWAGRLVFNWSSKKG